MSGPPREPAAVAGSAPPLPIAAHRDEILSALLAHPVIVVAGETGSGKSTQLPRYCLDSGRGMSRKIAHTQPRRLAARALATRISAELQQPLGTSVGFRVRFEDQVSPESRLILMTDGMLLTDIARDPDLRHYDTLIIDEAHERTLNIDLLFGVARQLSARRPELRVIITSATLDVQRVADFFGHAPIINVSGRGYPVEVRYRPPPDAETAEDPDLPTEVLQAYREVLADPGSAGVGDTLVFLPGEREIRDVSDVLSRELPEEVEVLPLYSRLPWEQQRKIFDPGKRPRIVLSTNVAETSVTVPGVRFVIDSGLARVSRYSPTNRLQRLPIEPVPQASADQRKGRCGRIGPGLCIRLYSQEDFEARAPFAEPEVLRTNLSALLLRLAADELGSAEEFPFLDPPDRRALNDGYRTLQELEAVDAERHITDRGRAMARLPLDPRLGRALLEGRRFRAAAELLIIVSGLSVPDPVIRSAPLAAVATVDALQSFDDPRSEFITLVRIWKAYRIARKRSRRELRQWCKDRRLSLTRLSEWENVHTQVSERALALGIKDSGRPASYTAIHRSLLAGFCTMIGTHDERGVYAGARGLRFSIFPGSPLKRRQPRWILAANIVETSRVFARTVAQIEPSWIEPAARHLVKREYFAADWSEEREEVVAQERVTLLGLTLSAGRTVNYGPIAPEESRHIFAREALVFRRMARRPDWLLRNDANIDAAARTEDRLRTRGLIASSEDLTAHYERLLPRQISGADALEAWTRRASAAELAALAFTDSTVYVQRPDFERLRGLPEIVSVHGLQLPVQYRFDPDSADDGATVVVPLLLLPVMTRADLEQAIPGHELPRIEALMRSLPKSVRKELIPIADAAQAFAKARQLQPALPLSDWMAANRGINAREIVFAENGVPAYLIPTLVLKSEDQEIARGSDVLTLRRQFSAAAHQALVSHSSALFAQGGTSFAPNSLACTTDVPLHGGKLRLYPGLMAGEGTIGVQLHWTPEEAKRVHRVALIRLARLQLRSAERDQSKHIAQDSKLLLAASPYCRADDLTDALQQQAMSQALEFDENLPYTSNEFDQALQRARPRLDACFTQCCEQIRSLLTDANALRPLFQDPAMLRRADLRGESESHLAQLLAPMRWRDATASQCRQLPRYLKAALVRWRRLTARSVESAQVLAEMQRWRAEAARLHTAFEKQKRWIPELERFEWLVEEYRASLSAQELKTAEAVSPARLQQRAASLQAWLDR